MKNKITAKLVEKVNRFTEKNQNMIYRRVRNRYNLTILEIGSIEIGRKLGLTNPEIAYFAQNSKGLSETNLLHKMQDFLKSVGR